MRETPPFFKGAPSYPAPWWARQPSWFFPRWFPESRPADRDRDALVDWYAHHSQGLVHEGAVLPAQAQTTGDFFTEGLGGYARLANAIIHQAILDVQNGHHRSPGARARAREARAWFFDDDADFFFAFRNCCEATQRDPAQLRWDIEAYEGAMRSGRRYADLDTALGVRGWRLGKAPTAGPIPATMLLPEEWHTATTEQDDEEEERE